MRKPRLILLLWSLMTFSYAFAWIQSPKKWTCRRRQLAALYLSNRSPADSTRRQALVHQLLWTFSFPSPASCDTDMEEPPQCKDGAIISGKCDELRKAMPANLNRPRLSQLEHALSYRKCSARSLPANLHDSTTTKYNAKGAYNVDVDEPMQRFAHQHCTASLFTRRSRQVKSFPCFRGV
jgi:hypothetical protein